MSLFHCNTPLGQTGYKIVAAFRNTETESKVKAVELTRDAYFETH